MHGKRFCFFQTMKIETSHVVLAIIALLSLNLCCIAADSESIASKTETTEVSFLPEETFSKGLPRQQQQLRGRRLKKDEDDDWYDCWDDSIEYCKNPNTILQDETVGCDPETCKWDLELLDPERKPYFCYSISINTDSIHRLPDFLEPCYWWEILYGVLQPTGSPTITMKPTTGELSHNYRSDHRYRGSLLFCLILTYLIYFLPGHSQTT